jgi:AcrR family transcriptional regulator
MRKTRAEKRERTREDLIEAAERLFVSQGFHATSVDAVAEAAGYTKGAVYSNFAAKEDLFLAVYERRVERAVPLTERALEGDDPEAALEAFIAEGTARRGRDDGWLAVFFEFWAHVLRHPELRARFAELHGRAIEPFVPLTERIAMHRGGRPVEEPRKLATAWYAMNNGLLLERLTRPDVIDEGLAGRMVKVSIEGGVEDGSRLQPQARARRRARPEGKPRRARA